MPMIHLEDGTEGVEISFDGDEYVDLVMVGGYTIRVQCVVDAGGERAIQLSGRNCNLEGEMPGLYYPTHFEPGKVA